MTILHPRIKWDEEDRNNNNKWRDLCKYGLPVIVMVLDHPSQNLKNICFPAMLQWPKESCYVANTLIL